MNPIQIIAFTSPAYPDHAVGIENPVFLFKAVGRAQDLKGKKTKKKHYIREIEMVFEVVTGDTFEDFRAYCGMDDDENVADYMTPKQIEVISFLHILNAARLIYGESFAGRKANLRETFVNEYEDEIQVEFEESQDMACSCGSTH